MALTTKLGEQPRYKRGKVQDHEGIVSKEPKNTTEGELSIWKTFERRCEVVPLKRRQKVFEAESRQPLNVSKRVYPLFSRNPPHYRTPCRVNTYSDLFLKDTRPSRFEMLWSRKLFENRISIQPVETTNKIFQRFIHK